MTDDFDDQLLDADNSWNAMTIGQALADIMNVRSDLTLRDLEERFRVLGCKRTYLVAWPKSFMPAGVTARKFATKAPASHALWICVNGEADMLSTVTHFGMTPQQNIEALRECGFSVKEN
jgi:hypothetical protein